MKREKKPFSTPGDAFALDSRMSVNEIDDDEDDLIPSIEDDDE